jgi:hypothetical protein
MQTGRGAWMLALCLLCACGSRSGLGTRQDGAAPRLVDSSIAGMAPDGSFVLPDAAPALPDGSRDISRSLPDAAVLADLSPVLPDAPVRGDVSPVLPDAPVVGDVSPRLPDASVPRDGSPALPDVSRDIPSTLSDVLRDASPSEPDVSRDVSPVLPDASTEEQSPSPDGSPSAFCSGATSHMVVNDIESYPVVSGRAIPLDCCEGGAFQVTTDTFAWTIAVTWRNTDFVLPATLDLANLPRTWGVQVFVGCPTSAPCASPPDSYTSGLSGTLQVSGKIDGYDMSLCLSVAESPSSPHPVVHTLDLYAPNVHAGY